MKKLYLINPKKEVLLEGNPYSLLQLAVWLDKNCDNTDVQIVSNISDMDLSDNSYVGISVTTATYQSGINLAKQIKRINPKVKTILGGYHTKNQSNVIEKNQPEIDFIVEGEGEKALINILSGSDNKIVYGTPLTSEELDTISVKELRDFNPKYFESIRQFGRLNYLASRGCPHRCSFCATGEGKRIRAKSKDKVLDDLEFLVSKGFNKISIQDNYFGYNNQRTKEICEGILERGLILDYDVQTRVESMQDIDLLKLMKESGCSAVYLGIENFNKTILENLRKSGDVDNYLEKTKKAIKNLLEVNITPYFCLQVGFLDEDSRVREDNINAIKEIGKLAKNTEMFPQLNVVYPGTHDYKKLISDGIKPDVFESFTLWEEDNKELNEFLLENSFVHGCGGIPLGILDYNMLKQGKFLLDYAKMKNIGDYMKELRKIEGVKIFSKAPLS